jgi:hypothetical protein
MLVSREIYDCSSAYVLGLMVRISLIVALADGRSLFVYCVVKHTPRMPCFLAYAVSVVGIRYKANESITQMIDACKCRTLPPGDIRAIRQRRCSRAEFRETDAFVSKRR